MANFGKDRTSKLEGQVANLEANQAQVMAMMGQLKASISALNMVRRCWQCNVAGSLVLHAVIKRPHRHQAGISVILVIFSVDKVFHKINV